MAVYATRTFGLPVSVDGTPPGAPLAFHLEQNYPNPFNPSTTINYTVGHAGKVTLTIFNLLGQEIATIVDGEVVAGRHEARWNAAGAASGVYFYRLNAGGYTSTRKLIVLK